MTLSVQGFDGHLAGRHSLDGTYTYERCHQAQPLYVRQPARDSHLWYSSQYWDWNLSPGSYGGTEHAVHAFSAGKGKK